MDSSHQKTSRERFWEVLEEHKEEIETHLGKLFKVKGVQNSRQLDMIHVVYCICCNKFGEFDPGRASFSTWVTMWGRALTKNYAMNSKGFRSPLRSDLLESELFAKRNSRTGEELESQYETAQDDKALYGDRLDREMVIGWAVQEYLDSAKDHDRHVAVLQTLMAYGFEVSDRTISEETGLSRVEVKRVRGEIMFELGLKLLRLGITAEDR